MTSLEICENTGLLLLGAIIFTGQSVSFFGGFTSGISLLLAGVNTFLSDCLKSNVKPSQAVVWLEMLSRLCLLSGASRGLAELLEFYDTPLSVTSGNLTGSKDVPLTSSFAHLVPTAAMPQAMPISVLVIATILFILGLEESSVLLRLSKCLLLLASSLFISTALLSAQISLEIRFPKIYLKQILLCTSLWSLLFTSIGEPKALFQSALLYLALVCILSFLPQVTNNVKSLLLPLGSIVPLYEAIEVPLAACCLGMALYNLFISTILLSLRCHFLKFFSNENQFTGTRLNIIAGIGGVSCVLVLLYNLSQLLLVACLADASKKCFNQLVSVVSPYEAEITSSETQVPIRDKSGAKYKRLDQFDRSPKRDTGENSARVVSSEDSGHSTDETDIDELVEEYRSQTKVLGPFSDRTPTKFTSRLARVSALLGTLLSVGIYLAVSNDNFVLIFIFCMGLSSLYFGLRCLPKDRSKGSKESHEILLFSYSIHVILFFAVLTTAWAPVLFWALSGVAFHFFTIFKRRCRFKSPNERESVVSLRMSVPAFRTRAHRVQTSCNRI